jgi:hypothetical protein
VLASLYHVAHVAKLSIHLVLLIEMTLEKEGTVPTEGNANSPVTANGTTKSEMKSPVTNEVRVDSIYLLTYNNLKALYL